MSLAGKRLLPREAALHLWAQGWRSVDKIVDAVATMQQESQFYTEAVGGPNSNGTFDYGWCQINSGHWKLFGYSTPDLFKTACFDATTCSEFARKLYVQAGYDLTPWVAYTSGAYKKYLGNAVVGVANMRALQLGLEPVPYAVKNGG